MSPLKHVTKHVDYYCHTGLWCHTSSRKRDKSHELKNNIKMQWPRHKLVHKPHGWGRGKTLLNTEILIFSKALQHYFEVYVHITKWLHNHVCKCSAHAASKSSQGLKLEWSRAVRATQNKIRWLLTRATQEGTEDVNYSNARMLALTNTLRRSDFLQFKTFTLPFLLRVCLMLRCQARADRQKVLHREVSVITPHWKSLPVAREAVSSLRKICALWERSWWVTFRNKIVILRTEGSHSFFFHFLT